MIDLDDWIDGFRTGIHPDADPAYADKEWTTADLDEMVSTFDPEKRQVPACIGHPRTDHPAYAWFSEVRRQGDVFQFKLRNIQPRLREGVETEQYGNISLALFPGNKLRHGAFLGAESPAVEGLNPVKFTTGEWHQVTMTFAAEDARRAARERLADGAGGSLARILNQAIVQQGVENDELASAAGITESTVSQILRGEITAPPRERLEGFADVLGIPIRRLVNAVRRDGGDYPRETFGFHASPEGEPMTPEEKKKHDDEVKALEDKVKAAEDKNKTQATEFAAQKTELDATKKSVDEQKESIEALQKSQKEFAAGEAKTRRETLAESLVASKKIVSADKVKVVAFANAIGDGQTEEITFSADGKDKKTAEAHFWAWLMERDAILPIYRQFSPGDPGNPGEPGKGEPEPGTVAAAIKNSKEMLEKKFGKQD